VYSVIGFVESDAPPGSVSRTQHAAAQKDRIRELASNNRTGARVFDSNPELLRLTKLEIWFDTALDQPSRFPLFSNYQKFCFN
jgi:hypothetical protein